MCNHRQVDVAGLEGVDLLAGLAADERATVADAAVLREFPSGRELVREGELTADFFLILEGDARVVRRGEMIAKLGRGEFFGERGALDPGPGYALARDASVVATTDVRAAVISGERFPTLLASIPAFRDHIYAAMERRDDA